MKTEDFDYELDDTLIAQTPIKNRSDSRLMIVDKNTGRLKHEIFKNVINYLKKDDVLVLNNTRVIPARITGVKEKTNAKIEVLLLKDLGDNIWETLVKPARRIDVNDEINFNNLLTCKCIGVFDKGIRHFKLIYNGILLEILDKIGQMPLPPYIHKSLNDNNRYQTVYAKINGSAAAPTAGFHFTNDLLQSIKDKGVKIVYITLHVGIGTFRPVEVDDVTKHHMHTEYYEMSEETAKTLNDAKTNNNRIISVGTTSTRTLETVMDRYGKFTACYGNTNIFIYPGFKFKAIDIQITNFHLPKSTLLMLVSAFSSKEIILNSYNIATKERYRFFSFGDAMMIGDFKDEI